MRPSFVKSKVSPHVLSARNRTQRPSSSLGCDSGAAGGRSAAQPGAARSATRTTEGQRDMTMR
ncbi:MAG TPA: hypothetical protein VGP80_16765 [Gemmatimonadales bacterium]|nr:hypothetical protein [Gemmatimonadales bacterium]